MTKKSEKKPASKADKLKAHKAGATKPAPKPKPAKLKTTATNGTTEPLSNFQTAKAGRVPPPSVQDSSNLIIHSVSVDSDTDFLIMDAQFRNGLKRSGEETYEHVVNKKMKDQIQAFAPHLAILANYCPATTTKDPKTEAADFQPKALLKNIDAVPSDILRSITVTKVHIKHGKKYGFQIVGWIKTYRGKAQIITTPFENLDSPEEIAYEFCSDVIALIDGLKTRVVKFLSGEERGSEQTDIFGETTEETPAEKEARILAGGEEVDVTDEYDFSEEETR